MTSNEKAIYNALKKTWGDQLSPKLTIDNLIINVTKDQTETATADIYAGDVLVATDQTWNKSNDDYDRIKKLPAPPESPYDISAKMDNGTFDGNFQKGVYWSETFVCLIFFIEEEYEHYDLLDSLKGTTIMGDIGSYPSGKCNVETGDQWKLTFYYRKQNTAFNMYPEAMVFQYIKPES